MLAGKRINRAGDGTVIPGYESKESSFKIFKKQNFLILLII